MRTFVGIPLPAELAGQLAGMARALRAGRPVPPENLHLTLAFLGEVRPDALADLAELLAGVGGPALHLSLVGFDHFGGAAPRSFHAVVQPHPGLSALRRRIHRAARDAGLSPQAGRFVPHVTLARFSRAEARAALDALKAFHARPPAGLPLGWHARGFGLFQSRLRPDGARYDLVAEFPLSVGPA